MKVNKLEIELEGAKQKFKQMTDSYQKEIEDKKLLEENLLGEVGKPKYVWKLVILKPYICMLTF